MSSKIEKPTPFVAIKAISETRPLTWADLTDQQLTYEPYLVNRAFSLSEDTTLIANLMNERSYLDKDIQFTFMVAAIRPKRRWNSWPKVTDEPEVELVARYYGMSAREARKITALHSPAQLTQIKKDLKDIDRLPRVR